MLNLTIGSYTAMKCSYYQNGDGELCCKTVKVDGEFKSGVKVKARFHYKVISNSHASKSLVLIHPAGSETVNPYRQIFGEWLRGFSGKFFQAYFITTFFKFFRFFRFYITSKTIRMILKISCKTSYFRPRCHRNVCKNTFSWEVA